MCIDHWTGFGPNTKHFPTISGVTCPGPGHRRGEHIKYVVVCHLPSRQVCILESNICHPSLVYCVCDPSVNNVYNKSTNSNLSFQYICVNTTCPACSVVWHGSISYLTPIYSSESIFTASFFSVMIQKSLSVKWHLFKPFMGEKFAETKIVKSNQISEKNWIQSSLL